MKTRLLVLVMAVVLCLSILPMTALAEAEVPAEEIIAAEEAPVLDGAAKPAMPTLTSVKNLTSGVKITWEKVKKADGYIIFRRSGSGAWERIGKVKKGTKVSYIDKTAESGTRYSYSVCIYTGTKKGSHDADGLTILRLDSPVIKSTRVVSSGIKITWNKVTGAKKYAVYRKAEGDADWTKLAAVKSTKYTDKTAQPGTNYTYTVRAVSGTTISAIRAGVSAPAEYAWLGTWVSEAGESLEITAVSDNGVTMYFNHMDAQPYEVFNTRQTLAYLGGDRLSIAEDASVQQMAGWRYAYYLEGDHIRETSRYPDCIYYRADPDTALSPWYGTSGFYGIFVGAAKDFSSAYDFATEVEKNEFDPMIFITTDWSKLNPETWYVVTAGTFSTRAAANAALASVQAVYADAYVKFSGAHK